MIRIPKTIYVPVYHSTSFKGTLAVLRATKRLKHIATIRSDWTAADWETFRETFTGCYLLSRSMAMSVSLAGKKSHNTDFHGMEKFTQG